MVTKELVIAAYDNELNWLIELNSDIKKSVYRKGNKTYEDEIVIDVNMGRCVHTFFYHILNRYDSLSDYTFFVQDYPFDHWEDVIEIVNGDISLLNTKSTLNIGDYWGFHYNSIKPPSEKKGGMMHTLFPSIQHGNGKVLICQSDGRPHDYNPDINVDNYWVKLFHDVRPNQYEFIPGGHFGITKEHAHLRSKEFYGMVVKILEEDITAPWMIERLECYIFNPKYKTKL